MSFCGGLRQPGGSRLRGVTETDRGFRAWVASNLMEMRGCLGCLGKGVTLRSSQEKGQDPDGHVTGEGKRTAGGLSTWDLGHF